MADVHDDVDKWLDKTRPDLKKYYKIINQCRFANYIWNYRRLFGEPKKEFHKQFIKEFRKYYESGAMEKLYCDDKLWLKLLCIIYPYNPIYLVLRAFVSLVSPIYKTRIHTGCKIYYLFNKFAIKKVNLSF